MPVKEAKAETPVAETHGTSIEEIEGRVDKQAFTLSHIERVLKERGLWIKPADIADSSEL